MFSTHSVSLVNCQTHIGSIFKKIRVEEVANFLNMEPWIQMEVKVACTKKVDLDALRREIEVRDMSK